MFRSSRWFCRILLPILIVASMIVIGPAAAEDRAGAVYVMTNQVANAISVFHRSPSGQLTPAGTFSTGGAGDPSGNPNDPLGSQGSVALTADNHLLFAVNAGSNEISVLAVEQNGLVLRDKVPSGGTMPVSLTLHEDLLYVLNAAGEPNITGFVVSPQGKLTPLAGSTRPLSGGAAAGPAEVAFSLDGDVLVVTEKNTNVIDTYTVAEDGLATGPKSNASVGIEPFGFAFPRQGVLMDSETMQGAPNLGAASSYRVSDSGDLNVISASVRDFRTAPCWVVITKNHRFGYLTNTASGTVSAYSIAPDGTLALVNSDAAALGPVSFPIDMAISAGSRFLYVLANGVHKVFGYRIDPNGSLVLVTSVTGLPPASQGIAAR